MIVREQAMLAKAPKFMIVVVAVALLLTAAPPGPSLAAAPVSGEGGIVFSLEAPDAQNVFLAGDFNNWNAQDLALVQQDSGSWSLILALNPGSYEYKFIVDGNWVEDPDNPEKKSDPFGGSNSLVTVDDNGIVASTVSTAAPASETVVPAASSSSDDIKVGAPRAVEGGVLFTYRDPGAGSVNLAGSFNGWDAMSVPLVNDGTGNWAVVSDLGEGEHEYKFVIDGEWLADPENPDTKSDPYGGSNSLVIVGADGNLLAAAAPEQGDDSSKPNTNLNTKLHLGGRYLTRFEMVKNTLVDYGDDFTYDASTDPRFRLQRPTQSVDLNFEAEVSEIASTLMRIRLDSDQNILQYEVAGFLDEANLIIQPGSFDLKAYWNQEAYTSSDLMTLGGNIDHEGTIFHDHLDFGKGSAGIVFNADPIGINTDLFFANVHNQDYYGDPRLYDNTGEDRIGLRLSKKIGPVELGAPLWMVRTLIWNDFSTETGQVSTGIPALDEHRAQTGDESQWYETETRDYNYGLDLRADLGSKVMIGAQGNYVDLQQRFVTGNEAGQNNTNGRIDVPFLVRDRRMIMGQIDYSPNEDMQFSLKHIVGDMDGADADQRLLQYHFLDMVVANNRIYHTIEDSPASVNADSTDFTWDWRKESFELGLWVRHVSRDLDYGASGLTVPADNTQTANTEKVFKASLMTGLGRTSSFLGHGEIEFAFSDGDPGVADMKANSYEIIFRYDRDITRNTGLIADLRYIKYDYQYNDETGNLVTDNPGYFAPFAGFRFTPLRNFELVLAYGVDPLDFSIDYSGRQMGRWWYRQLFLFNFPDATHLDAENYLAEAQVITLRAQLLF